MTDKPMFVCADCGFDAGSKFALKRHRSHCTNGLPAPVINHCRADEPTAHSRWHRFVAP